MHEPPKNNLGCNVRKTVHYSLNQILSYIAYASSIAACATFINDYSPIGYIIGVCEVYALWYDFFLKLLLFKHYSSTAAWASPIHICISIRCNICVCNLYAS